MAWPPKRQRSNLRTDRRCDQAPGRDVEMMAGGLFYAATLIRNRQNLISAIVILRGNLLQ